MNLILKTLRSQTVKPDVQELDLKIGEIDKEGFAHFMLKEIFEQPRAIHDTFRGRVLPDHSGIMLGGLHKVFDQIAGAKKITIIACGTSWHAGLVGEYIFLKNTQGYLWKLNMLRNSVTGILLLIKVILLLQ